MDNTPLSTSEAVKRTLANQRSKNDALYRTFFNTIQDGIMIVDDEGVYVDVNDGMCRILKTTKEALQETRFGAFIPPDKLDEAEAAFRDLKTKGSFEGEFPLRSATGEIIELEWRSKANFLPGLHFCVARDITDRRKADADRNEMQAALKESEEKFRQLSNEISQLAWMANPDGWIFWYNQRWYDYTGTAPEEMIGWGWQKVHDPAELPKVVESWKKAIDSGDIFEMVFPLRGADGVFRSFLTKGIPVKDQSGRVTRWFGTNTDITEQIKAEAATQHRTAVIDSSSDAIITKSLGGQITSWNKSAERIFGYEAAEIIGKNVTVLFPADHVDEEAEIISRIKKGELVEHYETVRRRKDGTLIPISLTVSPIRDKNGRIVGASKIVRDISSQKEYERRLIGQADELEQFAYVASHDLQEPLRKVGLYTQLLLTKPMDSDSPDAEKFGGYILEAVGRMQRLIKDLLAYSRANRTDIPTEDVSLNAVCHQAIEDLEVAIREVKADIQIGQLHAVKANTFQVHQLFQNLISNAMKFRGKDDPIVKISSEQAGNEVIVRIKDNGIGIESEYRDKIFRVFQRLNSGKIYPGSGIGLAICKKIVDHYGGRIWVNSNLGSGSTFYFTLPSAVSNQE